ncbi:TPA: hypothetical protein ACRNRU_005261, partial [Pseudomonas aeruginosa]
NAIGVIRREASEMADNRVAVIRLTPRWASGAPVRRADNAIGVIRREASEMADNRVAVIRPTPR